MVKDIVNARDRLIRIKDDADRLGYRDKAEGLRLVIYELNCLLQTAERRGLAKGIALFANGGY